MSGQVLDGVTAACSAVEICVNSAWSEAIKLSCWSGRKVQQWTDKNLPKPLNVIAQIAFNSLPIILAWQLLPSLVTVPALITFTGFQIMDRDIFSQETYRNVYNGTAFDCLIHAASNLALFATSGNVGHFIRVCINTTLAYGCFYRAQQT